MADIYNATKEKNEDFLERVSREGKISLPVCLLNHEKVLNLIS